jgi:hypothetical protein
MVSVALKRAAQGLINITRAGAHWPENAKAFKLQRERDQTTSKSSAHNKRGPYTECEESYREGILHTRQMTKRFTFGRAQDPMGREWVMRSINDNHDHSSSLGFTEESLLHVICTLRRSVNMIMFEICCFYGPT